MKYKLSDCVHNISGGTPKKSIPKYWNGSISWITIKDFNEKYIKLVSDYISVDGLNNSPASLTENHDILISSRGTVAR